MKNATYEKLVEDYKAGRQPSGEWNGDLFYAYLGRWENNELLDFKELVSENRIPALVKELRRVGIHEITISSGWSDLATRLAVWEENGAKVCGMTTTVYRDRWTGEETRHAAFLVRL